MSSEKTATDELRRMLDERGVEYDTGETVDGETVATFWYDREGYPCSAIEGADDIPDGEISMQACVTPEQAIAATVGNDGPERSNDGVTTEYQRSNNGVAELQAENVKLRELVRGLNYCCSSRRKFVSCERCPLYDVTDVNVEPKCDLMMEELGIEADA